ncbi:MDR family MFS transporter [Lapidilactobacillus wuchangensis]|uniref:MDR family MFS transporter n=1 Tax=Lapidilactobacillus wuchangensis TaxID=2486001 RepID=UPI000F7A7C04|nr:MFS transporter [Lapidilactobacillus wuchangensis]
MRKDPIQLKWLFLGSLITNTGISFIWPLTTIYMHEYLHETLTVAGLVLLINSVATIIGNYLGGWLFDHWKPYETIVAGIVIATASAGALIFWHGWPIYAILLVILGLGNGIVVTCINSIATLVRSKQPSYVFNVLYFTSNLGLVFGSLVVGFILPLGIQYVFLTAFILFVLFLAVALLTFRNLNQAKQAIRRSKVTDTGDGRTREKLPIYLLLLMLFVAWIGYEQWQSNISAYMLHLGMTVRSYSFLWTVNAVLIVTLQPLLTHFDDYLLKHLRGRLYTGFFMFTGSFAILLTAKHYAFFILAMAVLTVGEVIAFPAVSTFVNERASYQEKGKYQGLVTMAASAGRAVGPLIGALIIESMSYTVLFIFCAAIVILATLAFILIGRGKRQSSINEK